MFDYSKEQILNALNNHPKSDITPTDEIRQSILSNPLLKETLESLDNCRNFYRTIPLYSLPFSMLKRFEEDGDRSEFEYSDKGYFRHRGHLKTWGIASWLYQEAADISMLEDTMWAICDEYTWSLPAHMSGKMSLYSCLQEDRYTIDLFAAETGESFAEIIMMLEDKLNPLVVQRARRELEKRILTRFENVRGQGEFGWETTRNNWAAVCAGSVGMTAICALDDNERIAGFIESCLVSMRTFMSGFSADGACLEGTGYWHYGFGYFASFADMLYRRTGGEINLFADEMVHKVALFPQKTFFYGSRTVSFSDSGSTGSMPIGLVTMLSKHYSDIKLPESVRSTPKFATGGCHRIALEFHELLWAPTEAPETDSEFRIYPLPDAQWYIGSGENRFGFAAKAGDNAEPHNHNDIGSFITYGNGEDFFADLGSGEYSKQYFSRERYTFYHCGSQGHSVPIINGHTQKAGKQYAASDVKVDETGISMDIAPAYGIDGLISAKREFVFDPKAPKVTIKDGFVFDFTPDSLVERFATKIEPVISNGTVVLNGKKGSQKLTYDATLFDASYETISQPDHSGKAFVFYLIDLKLKATVKEFEAVFEIE